MKKFVLLCSVMVALCSLAYANGGSDCASATVIGACPYSDTGNFDGDNTDCAITGFTTPYDDVFYTFTPTVTQGYQMRIRSYGTVVPGIRVVQGACCTLGTTASPPNYSYSGTSVDASCTEPATVVTYLYVYLTAGAQYWIHVGTNANNTLLSAYDFNMWCVPCPTMEPTAAHNTCDLAWEIAPNDSIMGDSASLANPDWFKIVIPDYSPLACSLRVFVGGDELGHCISGRYPSSATVPYGYVNGRFGLFKAGVPCGVVADSVGGGNNEGCLQDAKKTMAVDPGTYYIKVSNNTLNDYVLTTKIITYNPIAACCYTDGSCQDLTTSACALSGGWSKAVGVFCATNPCPTAAPGTNLDNEAVDNACGSAAPEVSCNNWYSGVINPKTDADWYKLVLAEGVCESLVVDIYGNSTPSKWPYGQGLNPYVSLYAADCATILTFNDNNTLGVDPAPVGNDSRIIRVLKPGTYYIKVNSATSSTSGPYLMHITCPPRGCLPGDFCNNAISITALPYTNVGSTAWYFDDYRPTCMQGSLGNDAGGPDVIYSIQLDGNTCITCSLSTNALSYGSVSLYANCPTDPAEPCIAKSVEAMSGPYVINGQGTSGPLPAGTYYILVDELSGSITYTLKVSTRDCPYPCDTYTLCGSPAEIEANNTCPPPAGQAEITCETAVYGLHCPSTDNDFWKVTVSPMSVMTIKVFTGANCDVYPASGVLFGYYDNLCANPRIGMASSVAISNMTASPVVKYLQVYDNGLSQRPYKVEATCCPQTDYCANPIVIPAVFTYTNVANTCCATNPVSTVAGNPSGPDVIYQFTLGENGSVNSLTASGSGDNQIAIFTDCGNPAGTMVAQADANGVGAAETLTDVSLAPGVYYVSTSLSGATACGSVTLSVTSDILLPVEMASSEAIPGDGSVTLKWATASETSNRRFDIVRGELLVGRVDGHPMSSTRNDYSWTESNLSNGTRYDYTLRSVSQSGEVADLVTLSATPSLNAANVMEYALLQNYPNPFNPTTSLGFDLVSSGYVSLKIYNLMGQAVATVVQGNMGAGRHTVTFDASSLPTGIYLYRIEVNGFAAEKKMLLMK
jgi:hypothetical protein